MKKVLFDVAALIARVVTGVIFVAHGWEKWQGGLSGTAQDFRGMGIPMPELAAGFATFVETIGGILLILGLLVRPVGLLLLLNMLGAIAFVHVGKGILVSEGGWELAGALGALSLLFLALGGGRIGLDGLVGALFRRRSGRHHADEDTYAGERAGTGTTTGRTGGPLTPAESTRPAEPPNVPRQPSAPRTGASKLNDDDMRDIDALVSDDQPEHRKPPNR
jgi:uncharacterized membrane protein YphA (DoxX/SURF4 family)